MATINSKIANNEKHAWEIQETYKGRPHGWIQWKGTDVCLDFYCKCGVNLHFDTYFLYFVKCGHCKTCYMMNGHVEAIELEKEPEYKETIKERYDHE